MLINEMNEPSSKVMRRAADSTDNAPMRLAAFEVANRQSLKVPAIVRYKDPLAFRRKRQLLQIRCTQHVFVVRCGYGKPLTTHEVSHEYIDILIEVEPSKKAGHSIRHVSPFPFSRLRRASSSPDVIVPVRSSERRLRSMKALISS